MRPDRPKARTRALLPQPAARLLGLTALASIGALEWQRLVGGLSSGHALLWVLVAVGGAIGVLLVERMREGWLRAGALIGVAIVALFLGYWLSGAGLGMLKPRNWDDLLSGLGTGLQALGTVRLPYVSADPWPGIVLELLGAQLLILAGLLTFWPRTPTTPGTRVPLTPPDRGYPIVSLAVMLVVIASPVVSLGGTGARPLLLGLVLAGLTVCFLWLERLPFRPGLGRRRAAGGRAGGRAADRRAGGSRAAVVRLPLVRREPRPGRPGALLLGAELRADLVAARRQRGDAGRVRFAAVLEGAQPRRIQRPVLDDPHGADRRRFSTGPFDADVPVDWQEHRAYTETIDVSVRRMRIRDVIGAGTTMEIRDSSRDVQPGLSPGTYDAPSALRRGTPTPPRSTCRGRTRSRWRSRRRVPGSASAASAR